MTLKPLILSDRFVRGARACLAGYEALKRALPQEGPITEESKFVRSVQRLEEVLQRAKFPVSNVNWMNRTLEWWFERHPVMNRDEAERLLKEMVGPLIPNGGRMRVIASGGSGMVFLDTHRNRAVKIGLKDYKPLFEMEFKIQSRLKSSRIIQVEEFGFTSRGEPYIVMESALGDDLRQHNRHPYDLRLYLEQAIEKETPFDFEETLRLAREVSEGVAICHDHHIVHRDIKPANFFLTKKKESKLGDFGIAIEWKEEKTWVENPLDGTEGYLAPELALGAVPSPQTDVFALGRVLYQLFTGKILDDLSLKPLDLLPHPKRHRTGAKISNRIIRIIVRATKSNPSKRYPNARVLYEELSQID